jgi:hypothetical protein
MKRSCFALSILMASLSGSLLWVDSARSSNGASSPSAVAAREAVPRPPRADEECETEENDREASDDAVIAAKIVEDLNYCEDACPYSACPYEQCPAEQFLQSECDLTCPADLPKTTEASAEVVSDASECEEHDSDLACDMEDQCRSHYDPVYDAEVYGVADAVDESESSSKGAESYGDECYENYDYEAYSEEYAEATADAGRVVTGATESATASGPTQNGYEYEYGDEYGYDDENTGAADRGVAEETESPAASETAEDYGFTYEYEDDGSMAADEASESADAEIAAPMGEGEGEGYEYDYDYEYEYDYDYDFSPTRGAGRPSVESYENDYDYDYEDTAPGEQDAPAADKGEWVESDGAAPAVASQTPKGDFGGVAAHLSQFARDAVNRCEPVRAALEAGCKIVAWSSGIDPVIALEAATAEIAGRPADESLQTR